MASDDTARSANWKEYYAKTEERPPRETLIFALDRFEAERPGKPGFAADLGCGGGRDTIRLLRGGWRVLAVDAEAAAIETLRAHGDLPPSAALETRIVRMEDCVLPELDLVNSSFALPLCPPPKFHALWERITACLRPGGRFSGQFFGERDSFAGREDITLLQRHQAEALLSGLQVEMFRETEEDTVTPRGKPKHWHLFHIVARKAETLPPRAKA